MLEVCVLSGTRMVNDIVSFFSLLLLSVILFPPFCRSYCFYKEPLDSCFRRNDGLMRDVLIIRPDILRISSILISRYPKNVRDFLFMTVNRAHLNFQLIAINNAIYAAIAHPHHAVGYRQHLVIVRR